MAITNAMVCTRPPSRTFGKVASSQMYGYSPSKRDSWRRFEGPHPILCRSGKPRFCWSRWCPRIQPIHRLFLYWRHEHRLPWNTASNAFSARRRGSRRLGKSLPFRNLGILRPIVPTRVSLSCSDIRFDQSCGFRCVQNVRHQCDDSPLHPSTLQPVLSGLPVRNRHLPPCPLFESSPTG